MVDELKDLVKQIKRRDHIKGWAIENFQIHREFEALKGKERLRKKSHEH